MAVVEFVDGVAVVGEGTLHVLVCDGGGGLGGLNLGGDALFGEFFAFAADVCAAFGAETA